MTLLGEIAGGFLDFFMKSVVASLTLECMILSFFWRVIRLAGRPADRRYILRVLVSFCFFVKVCLTMLSVEDRCTVYINMFQQDSHEYLLFFADVLICVFEVFGHDTSRPMRIPGFPMSAKVKSVKRSVKRVQCLRKSL